MTDMSRIAYDIVRLGGNLFMLSFVFKRKFSRPGCVIIFLLAAALAGIPAAFPPSSAELLVSINILREFLLLLLVLVMYEDRIITKTFAALAAAAVSAFCVSLAGLAARFLFTGLSGAGVFRHILEWIFLGAYLAAFSRIDRDFWRNCFDSAGTFSLAVYSFGALFSWIMAQGSILSLSSRPEGLSGPDIYLICLISGAFNLFVVFLSISTAGKKAGVDFELRLAQEIIASGVDHYRRLDRILQEIRILRHDYKHQIGVAEELARISNAKHIKEFFSATKTHYIRTEPAVYCENLVISALIAHYAERFADNNISFTVQAAAPVGIPHFDQALPPLDNYEICIVLGNLLENSFAGSITAPAESRRVSLSVRLTGRQLLIEAKNTFDGKIRLDKDGFRRRQIPLSRKAAGGGYGLRSIIAVTRRHSGEYLPEWTDAEYTVRILLNL